MLKTLLPMALLTAMLPSPCRATIMDAKTLGKDVPAALKVMPITRSSIPTSSPSTSKQSVMMKLITASQKILTMIAIAYFFLLPSLRTSGIV